MQFILQTVWSGAATCSRVSPLCPFWPPEGLSDGPRRLLVRAARGGFLSPSLDGGLPLLELFNPSLMRCVELAGTAAALAPGLDVLAVLGELENTVVGASAVSL
jgi:hypothetical protein